MTGSMEGIRKYRTQQTQETREKAERTIVELRNMGKAVNFNNVSKQSGVSKHFLYQDTQIRGLIEELREKDIRTEMNRRTKYDKTSKSKDVIIEAKDKRIAKLEVENRKLKNENERLRGMLYEMK